ncbi:elongation factor P [Chitinivibrio alkaliphilus]|uniref:Elongation factor P n=1 Tax=Chitinivibrio alkaliphilus ACht1 TaxID=1313304 RepID=U7D7A8_9BACT|nr:elongation factor P [Chitinivibrio alkaliphilus]ERP38820.1 translation elongation factor P (EF-P) [Chitinivibrio alkaliphilus ACht1]
MFKASQLSEGNIIIFNKEPYKIVEMKNTMTGRGGNTISTVLRHIINGTQAKHRFKSDDKVERPFIEKRDFEYLYAAGDDLFFMDLETFDQVDMKLEEAGSAAGYLIPNTKCTLEIYEGRPIGIQVPKTVELKILSTEPVIKAATASNSSTKPAELETGIKVQVPMFIEEGEVIVINTVTGKYQGRSES